MSTFSDTQDHVLQAILEKLKEIIDPDLNKDIVSLGFVKNILLKKTISGSFDVSLTIELTTPACPVKDEFKRLAEEKLKSLGFVASFKIQMTAQVKPTQTKNGSGIEGIKNIIAVGAGKGGVGKSTLSINIAFALSSLGSKVGLVDGDIYGPSFGLMLGLEPGMPQVKNSRILPKLSHGLPTMTFAFFNPVGEATLYRGAMAGKALIQMIQEVDWSSAYNGESLDYLIIDMPPGTGDIPISLSHALNMAGGVVVTTPQKVSWIDSEKAIAMYEKLKVPVLGVVENMKGFSCEKCQHLNHFFETHENSDFIKNRCEQKKVPYLGHLPLNKDIVNSAEQGIPFFIKNKESNVGVSLLNISKEIARQVSIKNFGSVAK
jgi:ATP-binding protein involved in chromosome partitioning